MDKHFYYLIIAGIIAAIIPIVPQMIRFRIIVLRNLHLNWLAKAHENHFIGGVKVVRIILGAIALLLIILGISGYIQVSN